MRTNLELKSPGFQNKDYIPKKFSCEGEDLSPVLNWTGTPQGTKSFALIMDDPDAPPGTWVHWVLYDLPPDTAGLPEGVPRDEKLKSGALQGACWGTVSFSRLGYYGPCPPPGRPHRYFFKLYALDKKLDLGPRAAKEEVTKTMAGHVLDEAQLMGYYKR